MAEESLTQTSQPATGTSQNGTSTSTTSSPREWVSQIVPENLRTEKFWENIKDPQDLAVKHAELVKYQGRSVALPGKDAKPEEWEAFHSKFRPEKPDSYEMSRDNWPKEIPYSEDFEKGARAEFHKLGLTTEQGKNLYNWYIEQNKSALEGMQHRFDAGQEELRAKWGAGYEREMDLARRTMMTILDNKTDHPFIKWLNDSGEDRNPVLIQLFNELGKGLGEDTTRIEEQTVPTEEEITDVSKKIAEMRADPKGAYLDANHPGHKIAVEEMRKLYLRKTELEGAA